MSKIKTVELSDEAMIELELEEAFRDADFSDQAPAPPTAAGNAAAAADADDGDFDFVFDEFDRTIKEAASAFSEQPPEAEAAVVATDEAPGAFDEELAEFDWESDIEPVGAGRPDAPDTITDQDGLFDVGAPAYVAGTAAAAGAAAGASRPRPEPSRTRVETPPYQQNAANDERRSAPVMADGMLGRRSSSRPVLLGGLGGIAWLGLASVSAFGLFGGQGLTGQNALNASAAFIAGGVLPAFMIFGFGVMVRRMQDLRLMSRSLAEVALRLGDTAQQRQADFATPATVLPADQIAALERRIADEVAALERTFADNEVRVRGLVGELSSERDAMLNHAEQVRALLIGSHQRLSNDVEGASEHAAERIEAAAQSFTALLDDRTNEISRRYEDQGRQLADFFTEQSQSTQSALNATGEELARRIASTADEAGARLQQATEAVNRLIEERSGELERRAEELTRGATELSDRVHGAITSANERIAEALRVGSESWTVDNTLFLTSLEAMLAEKADRISAEEAGFTARITGSMEERLGVLNQEVDRFLSMIDDRFDEKMLRTSLLLEGKGEDILERFEQRLIHLEAVLDRHGQPLVETLGQHVGAIESSIERMDTSLAGGVERIGEDHDIDQGNRRALAVSDDIELQRLVAAAADPESHAIQQGLRIEATQLRANSRWNSLDAGPQRLTAGLENRIAQQLGGGAGGRLFERLDRLRVEFPGQLLGLDGSDEGRAHQCGEGGCANSGQGQGIHRRVCLIDPASGTRFAD